MQFDHWIREQGRYAKYAERLIANGANRDSLLRSDIADDFVKLDIPLIAAKDIVSSFLKQTRLGHDVAIFWDIENVQPPRGVTVVEAARSLMKGFKARFGGNVATFRIYVDISQTQISPAVRVALLDFSIKLVDCPHLGRKEVADKALLLDAFEFALDAERQSPHKLPIICIVSGDSDFSPLVSRLAQKGFHTVCLATENASLRSIHNAAAEVCQWRDFITVVNKMDTVMPVSAALQEYVDSLVPHPSDDADELMTQSAEAATEYDYSAKLLDAIRTVAKAENVSPTAPEIIRQSRVGIQYANGFATMSFSDAKMAMLADGLITVGGDQGKAWICIKGSEAAVAGEEYLIVGSTKELKGAVDSRTLTTACGNNFRYLFGPFATRMDAQNKGRDLLAEGGQSTVICSTRDKADLGTCLVGDERIELSRVKRGKGLEFAFLNVHRIAKFCKHKEKCNREECNFVHLDS